MLSNGDSVLSPARILLSVAAVLLVTGAVVFFLSPAVAMEPATQETAPTTPIQPESSATVNTSAGCLALRVDPGLASEQLDCLSNGTSVSMVDAEPQSMDGRTWVLVQVNGTTGWVVLSHLTFSNVQEMAVVPEPMLEAPSAPYAFMSPPRDGLTFGFAATTSPSAIAEAQPFPVHSVSTIDVESQEYLVYVPGAPEFANSLNGDSLSEDGVVMVRRADEWGSGATVPAAQTMPEPVPSGNGPTAMQTPPEGGLTLGIAGTDDLDELIEAQDFTVDAAIAFHVPDQSWLFHVNDAPNGVNTLTSEELRPDAFVMLRRFQEPPPPPPEPAPEPAPEPVAAASAPAPEPEPEPEPQAQGVSGGTANITYYFCQRGTNPAGWGDGGGFCGHMASGVRVYEGAAACARQYLGQQFRIVGDPSGRVYTCEDTGSAVHGNHRDIFFHSSDTGLNWQQAVGYRAEIIIVN